MRAGLAVGGAGQDSLQVEAWGAGGGAALEGCVVASSGRRADSGR